MMTLELSPIRALSYQLLRSRYEVVDLEHPGAGTDDLNFNFNASGLVRQQDGADRLEAVLSVTTEPGRDDPSGYRIDVSVRGMFEARYAEEGGSAEDFDMFMRVNSFTLLYAFIRSHVQMLTSMSPSGQVCLPCLDVGSIADMLAISPDGSGEGVG